MDGVEMGDIIEHSSVEAEAMAMESKKRAKKRGGGGGGGTRTLRRRLTACWRERKKRGEEKGGDGGTGVTFILLWPARVESSFSRPLPRLLAQVV